LFWSIVSADRLTELAQEPSERECVDFNCSGPLGIELNHVAFSYNDEKAVFKDFTENIVPGSFVTVTGPSGSGKTTFTRLLLGFLSQNSGNITLYDDENTYEYSIGIRKVTGYVPQGNTLLTGSVLENVCFGLESIDRKAAEYALYIADAEDFVNELPDGIDTLIGENSNGISEGQAQRIALARAIAMKPKLIILDEATSALDKQTEINILERLKNMKNRPTILCITHRDTALAYCDRNISISHR
jgi:ABC-type multidrug transport system fused ATPase/permease subunit